MSAYTFNYSVTTMARLSQDGLVTSLSYRVGITDGVEQIFDFGAVDLVRGDTFIPYEQITEEIAMGWLMEKLDTAQIEASLTERFEAIKAPAVLFGLPWGSPPV